MSEELQDWLLALGVLALLVLAAAGARSLLARLTKQHKWGFLHDLGPSISALVVIIGLKVFIEVAPLGDRIRTNIRHAIFVCAVLIIILLVRRAALVMLEWTALRSHQSKILQQGFIPLTRNVLTLFVFLAGTIVVLKQFGYDVLSLLTALGVGSLAVGLAAKDTLSHMISGFVLIIDRNLGPGDRVNLGGLVGTVEEIGLRSTRIRMGDGNMLIVPNSELVNTKLMNLSMPSRELVASMTIRVPYSVSFNRVREICLETIDQVDKANKARGKTVNLNNLSEGHQQIGVSFWLPDPECMGEAMTQFNEKLLARLAAERIPLVSPPPPPGPSQSG